MRIVGVMKVKKFTDPARIRTWNPLIRSQMPYPLGHRALGVKVDLRGPLRMRIVGVMKVKKFSDPARIRTWNPLIRSQMPYPLGRRALAECSPVLFIADTRVVPSPSTAEASPSDRTRSGPPDVCHSVQFCCEEKTHCRETNVSYLLL